MLGVCSNYIYFEWCFGLIIFIFDFRLHFIAHFSHKRRKEKENQQTNKLTQCFLNTIRFPHRNKHCFWLVTEHNGQRVVRKFEHSPNEFVIYGPENLVEQRYGAPTYVYRLPLLGPEPIDIFENPAPNANTVNNTDNCQPTSPSSSLTDGAIIDIHAPPSSTLDNEMIIDAPAPPMPQSAPPRTPTPPPSVANNNVPTDVPITPEPINDLGNLQTPDGLFTLSELRAKGASYPADISVEQIGNWYEMVMEDVRMSDLRAQRTNQLRRSAQPEPSTSTGGFTTRPANNYQQAIESPDPDRTPHQRHSRFVPERSMANEARPPLRKHNPRAKQSLEAEVHKRLHEISPKVHNSFTYKECVTRFQNFAERNNITNYEIPHGRPKDSESERLRRENERLRQQLQNRRSTENCKNHPFRQFNANFYFIN